ncbi:MAG: hypothetical protein II419_02605 [Acidaminococcaceae bacterium]|nr:hypothetical protein [Acidaminococcaceae bacterium]
MTKHPADLLYRPEMDPAGGMDWQAKRHKETGIALIPGVDQYEVIIFFPSIRDTGG